MKWSMCALLVLSSSVPGHARQGSDTGWYPVLQVRAVSSTPAGPRVGVASQWKLVKDGEPLSMTFSTGPTLCSMGVGSGTSGLPPEAMTGRALWVLTGTWLGEEDSRHQIRVTSKFLRLAGRESSASTTQTLSLRDGDEVTLDAISEPLDANCNVHTVRFDARLVMQSSVPGLAQATYAADLWLIHDGPFKAQTRDHLVLNIGTVAVPFAFNRISFTLPVIDSRQRDVRATISLTGSIRGHARVDGLVDIDLETNRLVYGITNPADVPPLTSLLRKTLTIKPGETIAVEFPPPASGYSSVALEPNDGAQVGAGAGPLPVPPRSPDKTVQVVHGRIVLDTAAFFRGHKTQLLITLKRLQ